MAYIVRPVTKDFSELQIIEVNENSSPAFSDSFSAQLNGPMTPNPTQNNLAVPNKSASQFSYNTLGKLQSLNDHHGVAKN